MSGFCDFGWRPRHGSLDDLVIGDGRAFDGASDESECGAVSQVAAVEAIFPLAKVAGQVLGADPVVRTDQSGLDVAGDGVDDREEIGGVGAVALNHWGVLQVIAKGGVFSLVAAEAMGQEMGSGLDVGFQEAAQLVGCRCRQDGDPRGAGVEAVLAFHGVAMLAILPWRGNLLDGDDAKALVGIIRASSGVRRIAPPADGGLVGLDQAAQGKGFAFAQAMAQLVGDRPVRLVGHAQPPLKEFRRYASLVGSHQIGGEEPLGRLRPHPVKSRSGDHRFLMVAMGAFKDPRPRRQVPSRATVTLGATVTARTAKRRQMADTGIFGPEPSQEFQHPAHQALHHPRPESIPSRASSLEHFMNLPYLDGETVQCGMYI